MIELTHVSKEFGPVVALGGVSLRIEAGERVGIVGANGSGKTTLLRALLGLVLVQGRVRVAGHDVAKAPDVALRSLAYVPQIAPPLEAPVSEVVRAWATLRRRPGSMVRARAERLGLDLAAVERTRFRDLSGGTKQKVLASLALASEAPILVADEPTANLDAAARAAFFSQVNERPKTSVLVLCSHRVDEIRHLVDRAVELRDGLVVRDGPAVELFTSVRSFRVEVAVRSGDAGAPALRRFLQSRGFEPAGLGRHAALFTQDEKLDVVARLLREHEGAVLDVCVLDAEDVPLAVPARPRPLRVVSAP